MTEEQRAKNRAYQAAYRARNREKISEKRKDEWRTRDPAVVSRAMAKYYRNHKDRIKAVTKAWQQRNPDKLREYAHLRRARMFGAPGDGVSDKQWNAILLEANGCCAYCGKQVEKLTLDHAIPLSRGGAHDVSNVVPACKPCNTSKHAKTPAEWAAVSK